MLEFKNVSVALPTGEKSLPISAVLAEGEMTCLCGAAKSGKTNLLLAVMGLSVLSSGHITIDGEPVGIGSAAYFRQLISYVPQHVPDVSIKVSDLCQSVFNIMPQEENRPTKAQLMQLWERLEIAPDLYDRRANEIKPEYLKLILLSVMPFLHRRIVLIDDMPQTQQTYEFVRSLADDGAEVLYTCEDNMLPCDKIINL